MSTNLGSSLDGAKIVRYDEANDLTLAWFGGHGIHMYDADGQEIDFWNVGDFTFDDATPEDVIASMQARILDSQ